MFELRVFPSFPSVSEHPRGTTCGSRKRRSMQYLVVVPGLLLSRSASPRSWGEGGRSGEALESSRGDSSSIRESCFVDKTEGILQEGQEPHLPLLGILEKKVFRSTRGRTSFAAGLAISSDEHHEALARRQSTRTTVSGRGEKRWARVGSLEAEVVIDEHDGISNDEFSKCLASATTAISWSPPSLFIALNVA